MTAPAILGAVMKILPRLSDSCLSEVAVLARRDGFSFTFPAKRILLDPCPGKARAPRAMKGTLQMLPIAANWPEL
jgi:hypothetical protein